MNFWTNDWHALNAEGYGERLREIAGGDLRDPTCPWCGAPDFDCDCHERIHCPDAGTPGHRQCGWNEEEGKPVFLAPRRER